MRMGWCESRTWHPEACMCSSPAPHKLSLLTHPCRMWECQNPCLNLFKLQAKCGFGLSCQPLSLSEDSAEGVKNLVSPLVNKILWHSDLQLKGAEHRGKIRTMKKGKFPCPLSKNQIRPSNIAQTDTSSLKIAVCTFRQWANPIAWTFLGALSFKL